MEIAFVEKVLLDLDAIRVLRCITDIHIVVRVHVIIREPIQLHVIKTIIVLVMKMGNAHVKYVS